MIEHTKPDWLLQWDNELACRRPAKECTQQLSAPWNNGKEYHRWCVVEWVKMSSSKTRWCSRHAAPPISAPHPASRPITGRANSVVSIELWGRHMGHHCLVDKIVSYLGPDFPLFHVIMAQMQREWGTVGVRDAQIGSSQHRHTNYTMKQYK